MGARYDNEGHRGRERQALNGQTPAQESYLLRVREQSKIKIQGNPIIEEILG